MAQSKKIEVTVHRIDASCPDIDNCAAFATIDTDPEGGYVIYQEVTDPDILAAFAGRIGPGEGLGRVPRHIGKEVFRT